MNSENVKKKRFVFSCTAEVAKQEGTGTEALRGLCDITLSPSLNLVPVREDYTAEYTHTPSRAAVTHSSILSHPHAVRKAERVKVRGIEWMQKETRGGFTRRRVRNGKRMDW